MKFKKVMCALLGAAMVLGMAGCGNKGTEELVSKDETQSSETAQEAEAGGNSGSEQAASGEKVKLTFLRAGTDAGKKEFWDKVIADFEAANPDIEIEYQECSYGDDFETKLNTGFASGTAPDVIDFTLASMGVRVPLGQYAELDEFTADWDGKDDYMESALNLGTINGKLYGIATQPDVRLLIYNKELFEEAGLDPDSPPTNWDELYEYHKKLVKKEGDNVVQTGLSVPSSGTGQQHYLTIFLLANGEKNLVDEDNNTVLCNSEKTVEAAEFLKKLEDEGTIPWDSSNGDNNPFASGLAAMTYANTTDFATWNSGALAGKIAMAAPLKQEKQATFCGMGFMFMSSETAHKEEAWRFMEYASSADVAWTRYEMMGVPPVRESLKERYIAENPENNAVIYESVACGVGSPKVAYSNAVFNAVNDAMERIAYGVEDPKTALDKAAEEIQKEIDNQ